MVGAPKWDGEATQTKYILINYVVGYSRNENCGKHFPTLNNVTQVNNYYFSVILSSDSPIIFHPLRSHFLSI